MRPLHAMRRWKAHRMLGGLAGTIWLLALVACTGTFESRPPTLLVVAFADSGPAVGLVQDTFNALQPGESRSLEFVAGSRRPLPAPAVAVDVVGRAADRPTAVFLLRDPTTRESVMRGFTIQGIDPTSPTEFAGDPSFEITLANAGPTGGEGALEIGLQDDYCPTGLQISRTGRYVAVFESRESCGGGTFRAIYVVDTTRLGTGNDPVVRRLVSPEPGAAGFYVDQEGALSPNSRELLYFVVPGFGVRTYDFERDEVRSLDIEGSPSDAGSLTGIGRIQDALALVEPNRYFLTDLEATPPAAEAVASASGLTRLLTDPFGLTAQAVLLAGDRLVVHEDARAAEFEQESSAPSRTDAILEPIDRFVYLLSDRAIGVFDLLEFGAGPLRVVSFPVPEIPAASVLTWTRARPVTEP